jgi:hypothetical protein
MDNIPMVFEKKENQDQQEFIEHSTMIGKHRKEPSVMDGV